MVSAVREKEVREISPDIERIKDVNSNELTINKVGYIAAAVLFGSVGAVALMAPLLQIHAAVAILSIPLCFISFGFICLSREVLKNATLEQKNYILGTNSFNTLYHTYGLNQLLSSYSLQQLKTKLNEEINDPKTTFWNVLRRYDIESLFKANILTKDHFDVLQALKVAAQKVNSVVFSGTHHHVLTAFANAPEEFREIVRLDKHYTDLKPHLTRG